MVRSRPAYIAFLCFGRISLGRHVRIGLPEESDSPALQCHPDPDSDRQVLASVEQPALDGRMPAEGDGLPGHDDFADAQMHQKSQRQDGDNELLHRSPSIPNVRYVFSEKKSQARSPSIRICFKVPVISMRSEPIRLSVGLQRIHVRTDRGGRLPFLYDAFDEKGQILVHPLQNLGVLRVHVLHFQHQVAHDQAEHFVLTEQAGVAVQGSAKLIQGAFPPGHLTGHAPFPEAAHGFDDGVEDGLLVFDMMVQGSLGQAAGLGQSGDRGAEKTLAGEEPGCRLHDLLAGLSALNLLECPGFHVHTERSVCISVCPAVNRDLDYTMGRGSEGSCSYELLSRLP